MGSDPGSRVLMGAAGWIIAGVGAWATIRNNGQTVRMSGGGVLDACQHAALLGIVLVLFGLSLIVGSIVL